MSKALKELNPITKDLEFLGVPGAIGISVLVPYFSYFFALGCSEAGCTPRPVKDFFLDGLAKYSSLDGILSLWDTQAAVVYFIFYAWCVLAWFILPGEWIEGEKMRNGQRLEYKLNAFSTMLATLALCVAIVSALGIESMVFVYDHWVGLVTASLVNSTLQACYCQLSSYRKGALLAEGGNSSWGIYNWFIGRELNPRIGSFDIKSFNELRPGLILWLLINVAMAAKQYIDIGRVTDSMILVVAFQSFYCVDALYNEQAILTTMDITTDGFGFMLSVGDLTWVPFTYPLQARYLASFPKDLGFAGVAGVCAVNAVGYYIFRISNLEKNDFRKGRNPKNLTFMETKRGTQLLTSGWWGLSRHPNYLGDWLMAWAWCLPTGFDTPITYFYVIYFGILLLHRQGRDDHQCAKKYGPDWDKYCKLVPSKIIPYIY